MDIAVYKQIGRLTNNPTEDDYMEANDLSKSILAKLSLLDTDTQPQEFDHVSDLLLILQEQMREAMRFRL